MSRIPVPGNLPAVGRRPSPGTANTPEKQFFRFSLRYWDQIQHFGLGQSDNSWFVALLKRLRDLCDARLEDVLEDFAVKDSLRIHDIDWAAKGMEVKLSNLESLPETYRQNQAEYPIMQIHISKANGRIIGFFDENQCFNIVLLDPNHNMQPSKFTGYKIRPTRFGECELTALTARYERAIASAAELNSDIKASLLGAIKRPNIDADMVLSVRFTRSQITSLNDCLALGTANDAGEFIIRCVEDYVTK